MKTILIIGMGKFGHHLCYEMLRHGNEIMVIDQDGQKVEDLVSEVTSIKIGDCTNVEVLESIGVSNFDYCFVCIGNNFQNSLEITNLLKEMGASYVVSKADRDIQVKFLLKNGADDVIYPDKDIAERVAVRYSLNRVFDYVGLSDDYSIYEIETADQWVGKTIREVNFRAKYSVSIIGTKKDGKSDILPMADHVFAKEEHLMLLGRNENIEKLLDIYDKPFNRIHFRKKSK